MSAPHAVMLPFPITGHINPMLDLARLLHHHGFHITFVDTDSSRRRRRRMAKSGGGRDGDGDGEELRPSDTFRFETIADGSSPSGSDDAVGVVKQRQMIESSSPRAFHELLRRLNDSAGVPAVTCVVPSFLMMFAVDVAEEMGIPSLTFWSASACGLMTFLQVPELVRRGYAPLEDESCFTNGYLDTTIDWIPGMKAVRLRDMSSFIRTTDAEDELLKTQIEIVNNTRKSSCFILNTFDGLEGEVLDALKAFHPKLYAVGPLDRLLIQIKEYPRSSGRLSLWEEDYGCKEWLNTQETGSVIYVSFGSLKALTRGEVIEFARGLSDSKYPFLWNIRANLLDGDLAEELIKETEGRCYFSNWCPQIEVLSHPSVGGFLTHGGWNSLLESICAGVPLICWPGFADQYTNCRYVCEKWVIGFEIDEPVKREQVRDAVTELMQGKKGQQVRKNTVKWKEMAEQATKRGGASYVNLQRLANALHPK